MEAFLLDERHLLLLGLLMAQSLHGYSINEFIETNLGRVSGMKRATAYALLDRLERRGLVQGETEHVGNYPPRKVYSITPAGRETFFELLQELLVKAEEQSTAADIALMFVDWLDRDQTIALLRERARRLQALAAQLSATPSHTEAPGVDYAFQRKVALLQAEEDWLHRLISQLEAPGSMDQQAAYRPAANGSTECRSVDEADTPEPPGKSKIGGGRD